ncbi:uncharacterized protein KGF55_000356 [Candida pseudojiufengensis]|uniref:uncharacterized protein n=1 Tax=Candida pseudojiufengensis TaxID=497109 RepID=UPI0022250A7B|nr:uncharacterized protein KGF55_000356 [Candida pseudojiufengensis]KAI5966947.1 hypothetical protein KGF55_000356 [Candida pseudojiufengensis]
MAPTSIINKPEDIQSLKAESQASNNEQEFNDLVQKLASIKPIGWARSKKQPITGHDPVWADRLPETTKERFAKHGIDISKGYPYIPTTDKIPKFVDEAFAIRNEEYPYIDRGSNADPEKKSLFDAAEDVIDLTTYVGTEIVGLQLADLTDKQKDELALLIAERVVVVFRDQDLSPRKQLELGHYWGQVEVHPQAARAGEDLDGVTTIWQDYQNERNGLNLSFRNSKLGNSSWHSDLVHEKQTAGITHLHLDAISENTETTWASTYGAYDKLSPAFQKFLDGKTAIYKSAHHYLDRDRPLHGPKHVEREHPLVRTNPTTGWKHLFVNRGMTDRIVGLSKEESDLILNYLFNVIETNRDIHVTVKWAHPEGKKSKSTEKKKYSGTSVLWFNSVSNHSVIHTNESLKGRHGTRVTSLAEVPYFDPNSKSQREALGLPN